MFKKNTTNKTSIKRNQSYKGERIEDKIGRIINNKEPITDGAPLIYTERKNGAEAQYNIKTDRWEIAIEGMDKVDKSHKATREQKIGENTYDTMTADQQAAFNKKYPKNTHARREEIAKQNKKEGEA